MALKASFQVNRNVRCYVRMFSSVPSDGSGRSSGNRSTATSKAKASYKEPFRIEQNKIEWVENDKHEFQFRKAPPGREELDLKSLFTSETFMKLLMPRNYKTTTIPGYESYAKISMVSSTFGTAASVLSTQALLTSLGVATQSVIPLAATINWVLKDGLGQLGGILFASYVNTRFDADPKRFRFGADACLAFSVVVESCTALVPWLFLPIASVANVGKNAAWLSASATRASIHQSFCLENNLADVTGKAGSQTITASLIGTALGIGASPFIANDPFGLVVATTIFSVFHLTASYAALHFVQLRSLNIQRAWLCLSPALISFRFKDMHSSLSAVDFDKLDTPAHVARKERILHFGRWGTQDGRARLASPTAQLKEEDQSVKAVLKALLNVQSYLKTSIHVNPSASELDPMVLRNHLLPICEEFNDQHLLQVIPSSSSRSSSSSSSSSSGELGGEFTVQLFYLEEATSADILAGFLHAALVIRALGRVGGNVGISADSNFHELSRDVRERMRMDNVCAKFYYAVQDKGWDIKHMFIEDKQQNRIKIYNRPSTRGTTMTRSASTSSFL